MFKFIIPIFYEEMNIMKTSRISTHRFLSLLLFLLMVCTMMGYFQSSPIKVSAKSETLHTRKFNQWSYEKTDYELYEAGCGLFATGNAIYAFTGQTIDISALKKWAASNGGWTASSGLYRYTYFPKLGTSTFANQFNFTVTTPVEGGITADNRIIAKKVSEGNVAAIIGVPNHFMCITDYDATNKKYFVIESAVSGSAYRNLPAASWVSESTLATGNTKVSSYTFLTFKGSPIIYTPGSVAGQYYLKNNSTGTYAYMNGSDADTTDIALAAKKETDAFKMNITKIDSSNAQLGSYIMPFGSKTRVVNPYSDTPADGTNVNLYKKVTDSTKYTQYWVFESVSGGYVIRSYYNTSLVMAAVSGTVKIKTYKSGDKTQIWTLEPDSKTLSSISVTAPTKTAYTVGDKLDTTGMKVTAKYSDNSTADVTASAKVTADLSKAGTVTATVSYTEGGVTKTATFNITVTDAALSSIAVTSSPSKLEYFIGETLDTAGMKITATYSNKATKDVTAAVKTSYDFSEAGAATVSVSYTEGSVTKTASFIVSVREAPTFFEGKGTESEPYLIRNKKELETFRDVVNDTSLNPAYAHAYYLQTADIDLENEDWTPIGVGRDADNSYNEGLRFCGHYDGGKHYIRNLSVAETTYANTGLFGYITGGTLTDLVVIGTVNTPQSWTVGGIAGAIQEGTVIERCGFIGDVTGGGTNNNLYSAAGGIVGCFSDAGAIKSCYHTGAVDGVDTSAGGIFGVANFNDTDANTVSAIENCYHSNGTVKGNAAAGAIGGALVQNDGTGCKLNIVNCFAATDTGANAELKGASVNTAQILRASEMKTLASDLDASFKDSTEEYLNAGFPVFTWQVENAAVGTVKGDVNCDGFVDVKDAVLVARYVANEDVDISETGMINAEVDGQPNVSSDDLTTLLRAIAHLVEL